MIQRIIYALYCVISLCSFSGAALGQEVEIYIPSQHTAAPESEETNNILARCLATGLKEYCVGISFGENGATFESNGISEITLETFVIDLSDESETTKPKVTVKNDEDGDTGQNTSSTDGKGSDTYNCKLSAKRAATITSALLVGGAKAYLQPIGVGEVLLKDAANPANAQNRRVSFLKLDDNAETVINAFKALCD